MNSKLAFKSWTLRVCLGIYKIMEWNGMIIKGIEWI